MPVVSIRRATRLDCPSPGDPEHVTAKVIFTHTALASMMVVLGEEFQ